MKAGITAALVALFVSGMAWGMEPKPEKATVPPDQTIRQATDRVQTLIRQNHAKYRADRKAFYQMVETEVVPRFDLEYIAQLILARNWREASADQRTRFQEAFKNMLIRSYADALLEYHDSVKAEWQPLRMNPEDKNVLVRSNLVRKDGPPLPLGFAMRLRDAEWKVYDITIENVSLISGFRSQIAAEIKKIGIDGVIERLERGELEQPGKAPAGGS